MQAEGLRQKQSSLAEKVQLSVRRCRGKSGNEKTKVKSQQSSGKVDEAKGETNQVITQAGNARGQE